MKRGLLVLALVAMASTGAALSTGDPTTGIPTFGSFDSSTFDVVNRQNLNVHFEIPIVSLPGRGTSFVHSVVYNSLIWRQEYVGLGSGWAWSPMTDGDGTPNWGWHVDKPQGWIKHEQTTELCGQTKYITKHEYSYTDPAGTPHGFDVVVYTIVPKKPLVRCEPGDETCPCQESPTSTARIGRATDGSGYSLDATSLDDPIVFTPTGQKTALSGATQPDRNGNFLSFVKGVESNPDRSVTGNYTQWTDTAGRAALRVERALSTPNVTDLSVLDSDGTARHYVVTYGTFSVRTAFACSGVSEFSRVGVLLPTSLRLPTGGEYTFTYEQTPGYSGSVTGRLARVALPTGGYFEYLYRGDNGGVDCADGTVRHLSRTGSDGIAASRFDFDRDDQATTVETRPQLPYDVERNQSVHVFSGAMLVQEKYFQGLVSSNRLLRTIDYGYEGMPLPASVRTTYNDVSPLQQSEIRTSYDEYGNLLQKAEYGVGSNQVGPVFRVTTNTYVTDEQYTTRHIVNLLKDSTVGRDYSAASVESRVEYSYDDSTSGYVCDDQASGAPAVQHDWANFGCSFFVRGNVTAITAYADAPNRANPVVRTYKYDQLGNLRRMSANGIEQIWNYAAATNWSNYESATTLGSAGTRLVSQRVYSATTGLLKSETDRNGRTVSLTYDMLNRPLSQTDSCGGANVAYSYDDLNRLASTFVPNGQGGGQRKTVRYDGLGRAVGTSVGDGAGNTNGNSKRQFDALSRLYRLRNAFLDEASPEQWTEVRYDAVGRVVLSIPPDGAATASGWTTKYAGASAVASDPTGRARKYLYDAAGRIAAVYEPETKAPENLTVETTYAYDTADRLISVSQGTQRRTTTYDGLGRVLTATAPETGTVRFSYNERGLLLQMTDARGVKKNFAYDDLNRPQRIAFDVNSATGLIPLTGDVVYSYGSDPQRSDVGLVSSVSDGSGSESYEYVCGGRISSMRKVIGNSSYTVGLSYNAAGQITALTYPSGRVVSQSYDSAGRLAAVASGTSIIANRFSYTPSGQPAGWVYGNGIFASIAYDPAREQVAAITHGLPNQSPVLDLRYSYGANGARNGAITGVSDLVRPGRSVAYEFDSSNRLTRAETQGSASDQPWGMTWSYDRFGNRTSQTVTAGSGPTFSASANERNQLTDGIDGDPIVADRFAYDEAGNMTAAGSVTFRYDAADRMVTSITPTLVSSYGYDANGLRVHEVVGAKPRDVVRLGGLVLAEYEDGASAPAREFVYAGETLVATIEGASVRYVHRDHLSMRAISDESGNAVCEEGHFPFGEKWYARGACSGTSEKGHDVFTTYERDASTDGDYAVNRYYSAALGRFESPDQLVGTAENPQSWNRYSYALNDPIDNVDPLGLAAYCEVTYVYDNYSNGQKKLVAVIVGMCWDAGGGGGGWSGTATATAKGKDITDCGPNPLVGTKFEDRMTELISRVHDAYSVKVAGELGGPLGSAAAATFEVYNFTLGPGNEKRGIPTGYKEAADFADAMGNLSAGAAMAVFGFGSHDDALPGLGEFAARNVAGAVSYIFAGVNGNVPSIARHGLLGVIEPYGDTQLGNDETALGYQFGQFAMCTGLAKMGILQ